MLNDPSGNDISFKGPFNKHNISIGANSFQIGDSRMRGMGMPDKYNVSRNKTRIFRSHAGRGPGANVSARHNSINSTLYESDPS